MKNICRCIQKDDETAKVLLQIPTNPIGSANCYIFFSFLFCSIYYYTFFSAYPLILFLASRGVRVPLIEKHWSKVWYPVATAGSFWYPGSKTEVPRRISAALDCLHLQAGRYNYSLTARVSNQVLLLVGTSKKTNLQLNIRFQNCFLDRMLSY